MPAPVGYTCPDIDKIIKAIKAVYKIACRGEEFENESTRLFSAIQDHLYELEEDLEQLRRDNAALREWGYGLEKELKQLKHHIKYYGYGMVIMCRNDSSGVVLCSG